MAPVRPFPTNPHRTAIAIAYKNMAMIADQVLPRITVGGERFTWYEYGVAERFTVPDTTVGRASRPTRLEFSGQEREARTQDRGLEAPVPQSDIDEAPQGHSPLDQASEYLSDIIELDREVRVADRVFDADAYPNDNKETLAGGDQWSDPASTPKDQLLESLEKPLIRPNVLLLGQLAWTKLRQHPQIVKAVHGNNGGEGIATRQQVAELFELEEILVGQSRVNIQRPGQAPELNRVWGPHALAFHRNRQANNRQGVTFGYTAQRGTRIAGDWQDRDIGLEGGRVVRVGEKVEEVVAAPPAAFFFENVVTP